MSGIAAPGGRRDDEPPNLDLAALHVVITKLFTVANGRSPTKDEVLDAVANVREQVRQEWQREVTACRKQQ